MPSTVRIAADKLRSLRKPSADAEAIPAGTSRRAAAALAPATERQDSAQAALHAKHDANYLRRESRLSGAPRAPVVVPEGSMPGPPGERE